MSFVTEPPLGPRPDLIEDDDQDDDQNEIDEEYDESRCQVNTLLQVQSSINYVYFLGCTRSLQQIKM